NAGAIRLRLGTVVSATPLRLDVAGLIVEGSDLYLCDRLRAGHREKLTVESSQVTGAVSGSVSCSHAPAVLSYTIQSGTARLGTATVVLLESPLQAGDAVLLLTEDDQTFYCMDKVVKQG
ncbi:MAG: DUF2577 family protein, partial [Oscillospiraceae bacterium]